MDVKRSNRSQKMKPGRAVIDEDDVREIRRRKENGESLKSLSSDFMLSTNHIRNIVNRKRWRHVE